MTECQLGDVVYLLTNFIIIGILGGYEAGELICSYRDLILQNEQITK
jgi:hypothetical protein